MVETKMVLDGVTVLDFTEFVAGPSASQYLADFGARVIKVEAPGIGDKGRAWGQARFGAERDFSSLYLSMNRNKESIVLNLKAPSGRAAALRLAAQADVVIENFTPGVADRLEISYHHVRAVSPGIIYCSVSAFGQEGPMAQQRGVDLLLQAYAGLLSVTGEADAAPVRIGPSAIDILAGTHAALGILLALRHRDVTGEGQYVDTTLYDAALHLMTFYLADYTGTGNVPGKCGPYFPFTGPYGLYTGSDGHFFLGVSGDAMWQRFCAVLDHPEWADDARLATNTLRIENREFLHDLLIPMFAQQTASHWVELATSAGIPATLVNDLADVVTQEQAEFRQMLLPLGIDGVRVAGVPLKLSVTPGAMRVRPPRYGEATSRVLGEFGFDAREIEGICEDGNVRGDGRRQAGEPEIAGGDASATDFPL